MGLRERIGVDISRRLKLEDAIEWAARNDVRFIDIQLDTAQNALTTFDLRRCKAVRSQLDRRGIKLGLHTLSAVNVAEYSPNVADAVTGYLKGYVDIYPKLGASWMVVHAGYHFTKDKAMRMEAGKERLKRVVAHAEKKKALVLLENLNKEPPDAEVHYLAHTVEEWQYYWDIRSPAFRLSLTVNHAHLVPEGVEGFVAALDLKRVGEVRGAILGGRRRCGEPLEHGSDQGSAGERVAVAAERVADDIGASDSRVGHLDDRGARHAEHLQAAPLPGHQRRHEDAEPPRGDFVA